MQYQPQFNNHVVTCKKIDKILSGETGAGKLVLLNGKGGQSCQEWAGGGNCTKA